MIEAAMLVALGFFAATLLALIAVPLVARRAVRSAAARFDDGAPLSQREIAAERDGVRALAAVEQRRIEQKLERTTVAAAAAEAMLGRRTADLDAAERARDGAQAERDVLSDELARMRQALSESRSRCESLGATVADLRQKLGTEEEARRAVLRERDQLAASLEGQRSATEAVEARAGGLETRLRDREEEIQRGRTEQARLRTTSNDYARERDLARNELLLATTQRTMLQDDYKDLTRRADDYRARLQARSEALNMAERHLMEETADRKAAEAALADLKRRFQVIEARLIEAGGTAAQTLVEAELDALRSSVMRVADDALHVLSPPDRASISLDAETVAPPTDVHALSR